MKKFAIYWPGEYVNRPNELALPQIKKATENMQKSLNKIGMNSYIVSSDVLDRSYKARDFLSHISDPLIGIHTHWVWSTNSIYGVALRENPLLLSSNFSPTWPGLVGLLNTSAGLTYMGKKHSRIWTSAKDWTNDDLFMSELETWCHTGAIPRASHEVNHMETPDKIGQKIQNLIDEIKQKPIIMAMLGDTSQGMINSYFGPKLLYKHGFIEEKIDQSWIIDWGKHVSDERIEAAFHFVKEKGVCFHWGEGEGDDFSPQSTKEQLRDYLAVLDILKEFHADCLGWQFQIGLLNLRPPSDFAEGLLNSTCRPESNGDTIVCATEADQGSVISAELLKRCLQAKGLHPAVFMHDMRWCGKWDNRDIWMLCNSGNCGAYAFNHDPNSLKNTHSYRQVKRKFPIAGGTMAGIGLPGEITWARIWIKNNELIMDIGKGEVVDLPANIRDEWWNNATPVWPFLPADLGVSKETIMSHYMSNHISVCYGDVFDEILALSHGLGFKVRVFKKIK